MLKNIRYLAARFPSQPKVTAFLPVLLLAGFLTSGFVWLAFPTGIAQAENIVVNSLESDVTCNANKCTLPGAIHQTQLNDTPGLTADTITFSVTGTINLVAMMDTMASSVTIIGPGADKLTVQRSYADGTPSFGIFTTSTDATPINVSISGITIQNGKWLSNTTYVDGGAFFSYKATTLLDSVVISGNQAYKGGGGVKNEQGKMIIRNSTVANNITTGNFCREDGWGGGILAEGGQTLIDNVTVFNNIGNRGGGIYINGDNNQASQIVTVSNSTVISNIANTIAPGTAVPPGQSSLCKQPSWGGGIGIGSGSYSFINNTVITGNVSYSGGGFFSENGTIVISGSAILSNTAIKGSGGCSLRNGGGGGYSKVSHGSNGPLIFINTTITNNKAQDCAGGGLHVADEFVYLINSTVTANSAKTTGGGFVNSTGSAQVFLRNSIVADNTSASLPETDGDVISQGYNLIGNTTNGGWAGTDQLGQTNIARGPLQLNGGSTPNYVFSDSRVINKGDPAGCTYYNGTTNLPLIVDQRGFTRPSGGRCDIGAVENQSFYIDLNGRTNPGTNYSASFVENSAPIDTSDPTFFVHSDAASLSGATVKITNLQDSAAESLVVTTTGTAITGDYNSTNGTLTLSGTDTLANYKTVLQSIKYSNTSDNPGANRLIEFVGTSNLGTGSIVTTTVTITAVNDAPVFSLAPQLTAKENLTSTVAGVSLTDPDANSGVLSVTLSVANGSLSFGNSSGLTFKNGVSSGASLTFSGTLTSLNNGLATLVYSPTQQYFSGPVNFNLAADDRGNSGQGGVLTTSLQATLNVLSALFVTSNADAGDTTSAGFGSLSYALNAATDPNRTARVINFSNALTSITATPGLNYTVAKGVTLQGRCGPNGAEIELNGNGGTPPNGVGLTLNGGATVSGLAIRNFNGTQLLAKVIGANGKNTLSCVRASRN